MNALDPTGWRAAFALLRPAALTIDARERLRVILGVGAGLLLAALPSMWLESTFGLGLPWLVAPMGASAVIVFALPSSPLAQPWAVVGGNAVSALAGIAVVQLVQAGPWSMAAPALGGAGAVGLMILLRCLHPPGGAVALLIVLGGVVNWQFALFPIAANSVLLVLAAALYNRATGKAYPHPQREAAAPTIEGRFVDADIDRVLARYNEVLDVPRDELRALLEAAESEAYLRRLGELTCTEVMSREVLSVEFGTALQDAWTLLRDQRVKALPVVDRARRVVGVVTVADFMRAADLDVHAGFATKLRLFLKPSPGVMSVKAEVVGQIMTRRVQVVSASRSLASMVPVFASTGHHHIPVVDDELRLIGILTQTDVVRALAHRG
ncbi:MAG TPA: HPP family protein [Burkholderiaceae bacterium]